MAIDTEITEGGKTELFFLFSDLATEAFAEFDYAAAEVFENIADMLFDGRDGEARYLAEAERNDLLVEYDYPTI